jgi:hypothetical protein
LSKNRKETDDASEARMIDYAIVVALKMMVSGEEGRLTVHPIDCLFASRERSIITSCCKSKDTIHFVIDALKFITVNDDDDKGSQRHMLIKSFLSMQKATEAAVAVVREG